MISAWIELVAGRLGSPILTTTEEVRFNCWRRNCKDGPDTKAHMYVNTRSGKFFCQRCQRGGSLEFLCKVLQIDQPKSSLQLWSQIIQGFMYGTVGEVDSEKPVVLDDYTPVFPGTQAYRYLLGRGISEQKQQQYALGFGCNQLRDRVVMPDFDQNGKLVYWVARDYRQPRKVDVDPTEFAIDQKKVFIRPRYKNAQAPRDGQLYNFGRIQAKKHRGRIFIAEGPISAQVVGYDCIATYGKYVTGGQISRMIAWAPEEYVILGEGDATNESISLATRLARRGQPVRLARFSGKDDPASVGTVEARRRGLTANLWNDFSAIEEFLNGSC